MKELNPAGNFLERLRAAYFLMRYPNEFIQGVIQEFVSRLVKQIASDAANLSVKTGTPPELSPEQDIVLTAAAEIAAQEANHG